MASSDAAQTRILKHMNADHQSSLSHYLQHYSGVPASQSTSPVLTSMTFTSLTILDDSQTAHTIPIAPPMTSWADARAVAVRMDREAKHGLGLDPVTVTRYIPPMGTHLVVFVAAGLTVLSIVFRGWIVPGTVVWEVLQQWFPGGAAWFLTLNGWVAWPMLVVHVAEAVFMARKVRRYGVGLGSALWWKWVGSNAIEGVGAVWRFNAEVKRLKGEEKEH